MASEQDRYNLRPNPKFTDKKLKTQKRQNKVEERETEQVIEVQIDFDPDHNNLDLEQKEGKEMDLEQRAEEEMDMELRDEGGRAEEAGEDLEETNLEEAGEPEAEATMDPNAQILLLLHNLTQSQNTKFDQLQDTMSRMEEKLTKKQEIFQEQIQKQIQKLTQNHQKMTTQISTLDSDIKQLRKDTDDSLIKQSLEVHEHINLTISYATTQLKTELKEQNDVTREELTKKINQVENRNREDFRILQNSHSNKEVEMVEIKNKVEEIKNKITQPNFNSSGVIQVTCVGNTALESLPTFNGRNKNPQEFLAKFKAYLRNVQMRQNGNVKFNDLLENCLQDSASRWWQMIKTEIITFEEFENKYLDKYWNSDIQRGIKRRVEIERYRPGGYLTRSEYFVERVMTLKQMTPTLDEEDIINILSNHFDARIQDAIRVQNISTIPSFEKLLNREDIEERNSLPHNYQKPQNKIQNSPPHRNQYPRPNHEQPRENQYQENPNYNSRRQQNYRPNSQNYHNHNKSYGNQNNRSYRQQSNQNQTQTQYQNNKYPTMEQQRMCQVIQSNQLSDQQPVYVYSQPSYSNSNQPINNPSTNTRTNTTTNQTNY